MAVTLESHSSDKLSVFWVVVDKEGFRPSWVWGTGESQYSGGRRNQMSEFKARLFYRVSSRTARTTQRSPVSKIKQSKAKQTKQKQTNKKQMKDR